MNDLERDIYNARQQFDIKLVETEKALSLPIFPIQLFQLCEFFLINLRSLIWQSQAVDVLSELEEWLYLWRTSPNIENHPVLATNQQHIQTVLNDIYEGNLSPIDTRLNQLNVQFFLGGEKNLNHIEMDWGRITVHPRHVAAILVLITGINRTIFNQQHSDYRIKRATLKNYIQRLFQFPYFAEKKQVIEEEMVRLGISRFKIKAIGAINRKKVIFSRIGENLPDIKQRLPGDLEDIRLTIMVYTGETQSRRLRVRKSEKYDMSFAEKIPEALDVDIELLTVTTPSPYSKQFDQVMDRLFNACQYDDPARLDFPRVLMQFKSSLYLMLQAYPQEKQNTVLTLINDLNSIKTLNFNPNLDEILMYLNQLLSRILTPIPLTIFNQLMVLDSKYTANGATPLQIKKRNFLNALVTEIVDHPEKSYTECVEQVKHDPQRSFIKLFSTSRYLKHTFFSSSPLGTLVDQVKALDRLGL